MKTTPKKRYVVLAAGIIFFLGLAVGYTFSHSQGSESGDFFNSTGPVRSTNKRFTLVRPLIAYDTPEATPLEEYASLKNKLTDIINRAESAKTVSDASVYYRNLGTGRWIGIKQNSVYYPASLLKVPVMIAYFRKAESQPNLFDERVTYKSESSGNTFEAPSELIVGRSYTIRELIEHMIVDSDNGATYTLLGKIDQNLLSEVYTDLGIKDPGDDSAQYEISTKTYALFFRILFNATYLSPDASEEALKILTQASYKDALVAGLPDGVTIAHKFGEHIVSEGTSVRSVELHDCGIVYYAPSPYLLCVMTRAKDLPSATSLISLISKTVYDSSLVKE